jgi:hypothetical protein
VGVLDNKDLLSDVNRVQVPWVKVTIGDNFTFGVYRRDKRKDMTDAEKKIFSSIHDVQYPDYVQNLRITKVNGQVNRYTLGISYPITQFDDPNLIEKVLSSASGARKIKFSYGDINQPGFIYKEEEAIITKVTQAFSLEASRIEYTIEATSSASLMTTGRVNYINDGKKVKPSEEIIDIFNKDTSLKRLFSGMTEEKLEAIKNLDDQAVIIQSKTDLGSLDLIKYLVGCMRPQKTLEGLPTANYIFTIHDETDPEAGNTGPYFSIMKVDKQVPQSDAYTLTIGYNTRTIVTGFTIENNENYALYYEYQDAINPNHYVRRINKNGDWEEVYCPSLTSNNALGESTAVDENWWNLITQYPINASITIYGLLRPATLMQYIRLNVIFPGGHKHISSGLYLVTKQEDAIDTNGYRTTLGLTKIAGDADVLLTSEQDGVVKVTGLTGYKNKLSDK